MRVRNFYLQELSKVKNKVTKTVEVMLLMISWWKQEKIFISILLIIFAKNYLQNNVWVKNISLNKIKQNIIKEPETKDLCMDRIWLNCKIRLIKKDKLIVYIKVLNKRKWIKIFIKDSVM